ncbi:hypothetical protein ABMA27_015661 [Loxostege sticticalis]|uniref:Palmitoyltransferase n=1 Tax=Loxostege sticticalis TaxID=481309 RepID=A0ABR3I8G0_LOXSC
MKFQPSGTSWGYLNEKVKSSVIVFLFIPCCFVHHMTILRSNLVAIYNPGPARFWFHFFMCCFCFTNTFGNAIMSMFTDTSLKRITSRHAFEGGTYCEICKEYRPPKSWHCHKCKVCILRRNHHCNFISRCVGMYNQRYYLLYQTYFLVSTVYSMYGFMNIIVAECETTLDMVLTLLQMFIPMASVVIDVNEVDIVFFWYTLCIYIHIGLIFWLTFVVYYHWSNALKGVTTYESEKLSKATNSDQDPLIRNAGPSELKKNLLTIFGSRWYLAIVNPFVDSPVPEAEDTYESDREKMA